MGEKESNICRIFLFFLWFFILTLFFLYIVRNKEVVFFREF